ncbi:MULTISPECIES: hypothetical protein [Bacillus]|uniref:Uncharacterized protein n=1 Tax=Bacillus cereus TaxID=1396 RepID=A0A164L3N4_BACCE|nr:MULTISPECIES: hypothetical protein [Bacillus]KZD54564.1 hypothetical protein B4088_5667 [Bacillus cereus]TSI10022.1 hypothetical protein FOT98_23530 [Bacillus sp. HY001]
MTNKTKLNDMVQAIEEKGIKLVRYGDKSSFVTTDEKIEIEIVSKDKKFRLNHIIEVSNDEYVLHTKLKAKYKKTWGNVESKTFATPEGVLNKMFNCVISGHCWYNGLYTLDLFDKTLEDALKSFMENVESNIDEEEFEHLNASAELDENEITIEYTDSNGKRMTEYVEFDDEIVVDEETGERYVICWLPNSEVFGLIDLSIDTWNK